jgi:hypothetical protein
MIRGTFCFSLVLQITEARAGVGGWRYEVNEMDEAEKAVEEVEEKEKKKEEKKKEEEKVWAKRRGRV